MKRINQEMLNRYAAGECSASEKLLVEQWLDNDSWDSIAQSELNNDEVGDSMWSALKNDIAPKKIIHWKKILLAASVMLLLGFSYLFFSADKLDSHSFSNESFDRVKVFDEDHYDVILSANSHASIDLINNKLLFSGDFILKPKRDFQLYDSDHNVLNFKAGLEYFVSDSPDFGKIVAFQKSDFAFLPSSMQIKIREQFQRI